MKKTANKKNHTTIVCRKKIIKKFLLNKITCIISNPAISRTPIYSDRCDMSAKNLIQLFQDDCLPIFVDK